MDKDTGLDKLAQMVARGFAAMERRFESIEQRFDTLEQRFDTLEQGMEKGFAEINRRLDQSIQPQLDAHATRIKKLEEPVYPR